MPGGRRPAWESTVAQQKAENIHINEARDEADFVARRKERDKKLPLPKLMLQSLQVNIQGGRLPAPESNGTRYVKTPLNHFDDAAWEKEDKE